MAFADYVDRTIARTALTAAPARALVGRIAWQGWANGLKAFRAWRHLSLSRQFAIMGACVLIGGMSVIGSWVSKKIEQSVTNHSAAAAALYMDAFITPIVQGLARSDELADEKKLQLDQIMELREIKDNVVSIKVWKKDGGIAYSNFPELIGKRYEPTAHLREAWAGAVSAHISDLGHEDDHRERQLGMDLIEIYAPIRERHSNRIIAVSEFYMKANALRSSIRSAQLQSWGVVGASGFAMMLCLFTIVRAGARTIEEQKRALGLRAEQNADLRFRIEQAYWRADKINEQYLRTLGADLHDGPAQNLGFALMSLDDLPLDHSKLSDAESPLETIRKALEDAIRDIRTLSRGLVLPELDALSLNETAALAAQLHEERTGTSVTLRVPKRQLAASKELKICTYRLIQEGLNNAFKHAGGVDQCVSVMLEGTALSVVVSDKGPGVGQSQDQQSSLERIGLVGIRDRVETLSGALTVVSAQGGGTRLTATFDLDKVPGMPFAEGATYG